MHFTYLITLIIYLIKFSLSLMLFTCLTYIKQLLINLFSFEQTMKCLLRLIELIQNCLLVGAYCIPEWSVFRHNFYYKVYFRFKYFLL